MDTLTLKVPRGLLEQLNMVADQKGLNRSAIIREAIQEYLINVDSNRPGSFYELSRDVAGSVNAPSDLSTSKHFLDGYGG